MNQFIKDYFTFNKRERRGIFILVAIVIVLLITINVSPYFYSKQSVDFSQFEKEIDEFQLAIDSANIADENKSGEDEFSRDDLPDFSDAERFEFNPNKLPEDEWKRLGLTGKQINIIKNYETHGGNFKTKEDLRKIFGITKQQYKSLEPYINIPPDTMSNYQSAYYYHKQKKEQLLVEINSADTSEFKKLKGIGSSFAKRIVKYRNELGGFVSIDQVMEVFGFPPFLFDSISANLMIDTAGLVRKNINNCTADELKKHPYIKWNVANAIVAYREKHGGYKNTVDIRKTDLVDEDLYRKIAPYLRVE